MSPELKLRFWNLPDAVADPVTLWAVVAVAALLLLAFLLTTILKSAGKLSPDHATELFARTRSWCVIALIFLAPLLLGAFWVILAVTILSLLCYREYAKATGLFRHYGISLCVVLGILLLAFAAADHWYGFFVALPALGVVSIAAVSVLADNPTGYIQRTALGVFAFLLFGFCLAHLAFIANDPGFRAILILLFAAVELNDVFAYLFGKLIGKRKLIPRTSPNKTLGGALGALVATTVLIATVGHFIFRDTPLDHPSYLIALGLVVSLSGQLGDLVLSSIKRDLGVKDMAATIPGHGGVLDRFDSMLLAAPAFFHFVGYFNGFGVDQATRLITG